MGVAEYQGLELMVKRFVIETVKMMGACGLVLFTLSMAFGFFFFVIWITGDWDMISPVWPHSDDRWSAADFRRALAPYFAEYGRLVFTPAARQPRLTLLKPTGPRSWEVFQVLVDPQGDNLWAIEAAIDLSGQRDPEGPILQLRRIGC